MKAELQDLLLHLNAEFAGLLVSVNIEDYVEKILKYAAIISVKEQDTLQAFIAYYHNDQKQHTAFLSMLAVALPYRTLGLGQRLLNQSINHLKSLNFKVYELEVLKTNQTAINFYERNGFVEVERVGSLIRMTKQL